MYFWGGGFWNAWSDVVKFDRNVPLVTEHLNFCLIEIFTDFFPGHNFQTVKAINLKLQPLMAHTVEKYTAQGRHLITMCKKKTEHAINQYGSIIREKLTILATFISNCY